MGRGRDATEGLHAAPKKMAADLDELAGKLPTCHRDMATVRADARAGIGAAVGSVAPVAGTAAGTVVGAGVAIFSDGAIDSLFDNGPDVGAAWDAGVDALADTGDAIADGVGSVVDGIGGLFE